MVGTNDADRTEVDMDGGESEGEGGEDFYIIQSGRRVGLLVTGGEYTSCTGLHVLGKEKPHGSYCQEGPKIWPHPYWDSIQAQK
jgi:hypothetical protein